VSPRSGPGGDGPAATAAATAGHGWIDGEAPVAIGDVQGCFDCLEALVARIDASAGRPARLWLTGDLVNRGPKSLETLRWAMANEARLVTVLGNHDLHLLAVAAGIRPPHRSDTLAEILAAPDAADLLDWLRRRPLAHLENGHLMVHAGVLPQWSGERTLELAAEVQQVLAGPRWTGFLRKMYGNEPARWDDGLRGADRLRVIVNALTRLRFCTPDGTMDFHTKEGAGGAPPGHLPWFDVPGRASARLTLVFGHWSTLGLVLRPDLVALDTGCVWGGALTGVRLDDREVFSLVCPQAQKPGRKAG
jgi:bis(5'-nucleosyl)-tetraphosphatase (symmetrical)